MLLTDWDWNVALDVSKEEGIEIGMENGRRKNALAMKREGMDVNTISRITGLSVDTILRL